MFRKAVTRFSSVLGLLMLLTSRAWASSAGMPWEGSMKKIVQSLTGPIAQAVGVFAIFGLGAGVAFSEGGSGMRKALWVVLGLTITFSATSFGLSFMGFSGGLSI
jgi:type IV secretory pathway VirB2 component (pilin)